jgi:hypothetical protein
MQGMSTTLADRSADMMLWLGNRSKEETLGTILSMGLLDGVVVTANDLRQRVDAASTPLARGGIPGAATSAGGRPRDTSGFGAGALSPPR